MSDPIVPSFESGVANKKRGALNPELYAPCLLALVFLLSASGCVRFAGGAGYWRSNPDGSTTAKQTGFDTADYIPGNRAPGQVTV